MLAPVPVSAGAARVLIEQACAEGGAADFLDTAVLLTSELVTNAILHARTEFEVAVEALPEGVRVEVRDGDERRPVRRDYDDDASTGRGGALVELLAGAHGTEAHAPGGKVVWFSMGTLPARPEATATRAHRMTGAVHVPIELVGLPTRLYRAWQQNADGLLREAYIAASEPRPGTQPVVTLDEHATAAQALRLLVDAVDDALASQTLHERVAIRLSVPVADVLAFAVLRGALGKATAAAAAGLLLCPPPLPELGSLRDWCCDEVARQARGLPAQPWTRATPIDARGSGVRAACLAVRASAAPELLADDHNVLIAVSASASRLLGWPDGHLEGARVTVVVPQRYVDAHLEGFRRLITTGEGRLLDKPTILPARRRDGTEVTVQLTLSQRTEPDGQLFHVLLEPPDAEGGQTPTALKPPST